MLNCKEYYKKIDFLFWKIKTAKIGVIFFVGAAYN